MSFADDSTSFKQRKPEYTIGKGGKLCIEKEAGAEERQN